MTFASWLRGLARGTGRTQPRPRRATPRAPRPPARLGVEGLEDRTVPSTTAITSTTGYDTNNDGVVDARVWTTDTLDNQGNLLGSVVAYDGNNDGTVDFSSSLTQSF